MAVSAAGAVLLAFLVGVGIGMADAFPATLLRQAKDAAEDLTQNWRHYLGLRSKYLHPARHPAGVTSYDPQLAFQGYTFVTAYMADGFDAYLLSMDGKVVHRWNAVFSRIWPEGAKSDPVGWDGDAAIHGAWLGPDGEVVLDIAGLGTAALDRCGAVRWTLDRRTHHDVATLPDGSFLIPSRERRTGVGEHLPLVDVGPDGFYWDDQILQVDAAGRVLRERSMLELLFDDGWPTLVFAGPGAAARIAIEDPLHLNDIDVLDPSLAAAFPMFAPGDLLISLRNINTILVADPLLRKIKWKMTGPFFGQHDPDFMPDGKILLYDNRITGATPKLGNSRLLAIDPATKSVMWSFEGTGEQAFYAHGRGEQQALPNGNILLVDPQGGRLIEIAPQAGNRTVWQWVNEVQDGFVGEVVDAERIPPGQASWLGRPCDPDLARH